MTLRLGLVEEPYQNSGYPCGLPQSQYVETLPKAIQMPDFLQVLAREGVLNSDLVFKTKAGEYEIRKPESPPWNLKIKAWLPNCLGGWPAEKYRTELANYQKTRFRDDDDLTVEPVRVLTMLLRYSQLKGQERSALRKYLTQRGSSSVQQFVQETLTMSELDDPKKAGPAPSKRSRNPPSYADFAIRGWNEAYKDVSVDSKG